MSDNKKYYYIRIKEDFFEKEDIKILQAMDDGYLFSDILMKLYLKSLKDNGKLMFKDHIPYNAKMISTITNHSVAVVEKAIQIFVQLGLIEILDNGAIYMLDIQNFIGRSSSEGDRKREYRKRIEEDKLQLKSKGQMSDKCLDGDVIEEGSNSVIKPKGQMSDNRPPEKEIEIEKEIEKELQQDIKEGCCDSDFNIFSYAEERNFILSPIQIQKIQEDISIYSLEEVKKALDIADDNGKHTYSYVKGILEKRRAGAEQKKKSDKAWEEMKKAAENGQDPF